VDSSLSASAPGRARALPWPAPWRRLAVDRAAPLPGPDNDPYFGTGGETMRSADRTTTLLGRRGERERLTQLVHSIQPGQSQVLVLCGGLGVGKTALLRYVHDNAAGCHVARSAGVGPEL
jgi:hypothetical protein